MTVVRAGGSGRRPWSHCLSCTMLIISCMGLEALSKEDKGAIILSGDGRTTLECLYIVMAMLGPVVGCLTC